MLLSKSESVKRFSDGITKPLMSESVLKSMSSESCARPAFGEKASAAESDFEVSFKCLVVAGLDCPAPLRGKTLTGRGEGSGHIYQSWMEQ